MWRSILMTMVTIKIKITMTVIRVMTLVGLTWSVTEFQQAEVGLNVSEWTSLMPNIHFSPSGKARRMNSSIPSGTYRFCSRTAHGCSAAERCIEASTHPIHDGIGIAEETAYDGCSCSLVCMSFHDLPSQSYHNQLSVVLIHHRLIHQSLNSVREW